MCPEPDNLDDKNAIQIQACLQEDRKTLGYVPVKKIPKVTQSLRKGEIKSMRLRQVTCKYLPPVGGMRFTGEISVVKYGQWLKDYHNFSYNDSLQFL